MSIQIIVTFANKMNREKERVTKFINYSFSFNSKLHSMTLKAEMYMRTNDICY